MELHYSFKHMGPSDTLRDYAAEKSQKLAKYFDGKSNVTWSMSVEKQNRIVHCHLVGRNLDCFGEAVSEDFYASIDLALEKIEKQLRKHKEIVKDHLHRGAGHKTRQAG
jgi:putative sigma-54 modulation protein